MSEQLPEGHADKVAERLARNAPYAIPYEIVNAAVDAAYMEFCRSLGNWNPQFPGQRDALKRALRHAWEISANLIEAAALGALAGRLADQVLGHSAAVARNPEGSERRFYAATALVVTQQIIDLIVDEIRERDPFDLTEMGGADRG